MSYITEQVMVDSHPLANPRHRLAGILLDGLLLMVTFYIGWIIWTLILWGRGQTPAKMILKMRVMDYKSKRPASWGQMAVRQFLIPATPSVLIGAAYGAWVGHHSSNFDQVVPSGTYLVALILLYVLLAAYGLTDFLWIFRKERRRLVDYFASTYVINEAETIRTPEPTHTYTSS